MKNKFIAALLAMAFGGFGIHKIYLGKIMQAILHFIVFPFGWAVAVFEAFGYLLMSTHEFDARFNMRKEDAKLRVNRRKLEEKRIEVETKRLERQALLEEEEFKQRIEESKRQAALRKQQRRPLTSKMADEIAAWDELRQKGIISAIEFEQKKEQIILNNDNDK